MNRRAALLALAVLAACVRNPVTGKRQLSLVSTEQEIQLGKQGAAEVEQSIGKYPDAKVQQYVEGVGMRIAKASERPNLPWSFVVLDDPSVNAFALPGGPIFITRGILTYMNSEAELAAVLGHEAGHITARHSVEQISKAQLAQVGLGVGMILSPELREIGQLAGVGLQLMFLKFGRDDERQADDIGFRYMVGQGYDPRRMADLFVMLERSSKKEGGGGRLPEWLSTHPDPGNREKAALERARKVANPDGLKVERDAFLAHVNGMVFGEDPRQGFFKGNEFLHPGLRFKMTLPEGWAKQNMPSAVVALSPKKDAAMQLTPAGKISPEEASRKFFSQQGVRPASLAGGAALPPASSYFAAKTEQGEVAGLVSFVSQGGTTYQILGYTAPRSIPAYDAAFRATVASFGPLTDPAALSVAPARIELVKVPRDMTVAEFNGQFPSTAPVETVATVNGLSQGGTLRAGQTAKRIVGGSVPRS